MGASYLERISQDSRWTSHLPRLSLPYKQSRASHTIFSSSEIKHQPGSKVSLDFSKMQATNSNGAPRMKLLSSCGEIPGEELPACLAHDSRMKRDGNTNWQISVIDDSGVERKHCTNDRQRIHTLPLFERPVVGTIFCGHLGIVNKARTKAKLFSKLVEPWYAV